jgi:hypothetical protein
VATPLDGSGVLARRIPLAAPAGPQAGRRANGSNRASVNVTLRIDAGLPVVASQKRARPPTGPIQIEVGLTMNSSSTVSAELGLRLVVPQQTIVPLVASLYYSKEDPYAIRIAFHVGLDEPVEWIFARELLSKGIEGREGLGDVVVWPSAGSADGLPGSVLNIELSSPFGQAHFEAPIKEVADFLKRTYAIVPAGDEAEFVNVEAELADLLRKAQ